MNAPQHFGFTSSYNAINREERNLAAIFYHCLNLPGNLERFVAHVAPSTPLDPNHVGVFYEYSFLRDLWHWASDKPNAEALKRAFILAQLPGVAAYGLENMSVLEFNTFFGAVPKASETYIQHPRFLSLSRYAERVKDNPQLLQAISEFKWCFNAKPDIVIHCNASESIVIEAKDESSEGLYPASESEKTIFKNAGLSYVSQTHIQRKIMAMLGLEMTGVFLITKDEEAPEGYRKLLWREAFQLFNLEDIPRFMHERIERC